MSTTDPAVPDVPVPEVEKVGPKEYTHEGTDETFKTKSEAEKAAEEAAFQESLRAEAAAQGVDGGVVPEQRPQAFTQGTHVSESSKRLDNPELPTKEGYDRANSDEAKEASQKNSRTPRLYDGQRVEITGGPEKGRMAHIVRSEYKDGVQAMVAQAGIGESRFAQVDKYIVRTRDGRSDVLQVNPEHVTPLDDIEGWGRGQI